MHNRLMALWASAKLPETLSRPLRHEIIDELWLSQQADGEWTTMSLGPWAKHDTAPLPKGSDSYATALVAFILQQAGVPVDDKRLHKALDWMRAHQDRQSGSWADARCCHFFRRACAAGIGTIITVALEP